MELSASPMTERQRNYRATYRYRIAGWYNGWLHVFVIYVIGFTALSVYFANVNDLRWWELAIVPVTFLAANFFEWWIHRFVMHRPSQVKAFRAIYNRHTLMHHQFFTEKEMRFADHHDWRVTFFPPYALVTFTMMSIIPALVLGWLVSPNVGWLLISTTTSMYLIYEFMHFCCHVDENWFVRHAPFVNTIRRHHTAHHDQSIMMERNMNLTFPVMDWLMGTSDLDRGLIGHLLNGYDNRYVKTNMRKTSRTPRPGKTADLGRRQGRLVFADAGGIAAGDERDRTALGLAAVVCRLQHGLHAGAAHGCRHVSVAVAPGAGPVGRRDALDRRQCGVAGGAADRDLFLRLQRIALVFADRGHRPDRAVRARPFPGMAIIAA